MATNQTDCDANIDVKYTPLGTAVAKEVDELRWLQEVRERVVARPWWPGRGLRLLILNRRIAKAISRVKGVSAAYASIHSA